MFGRKKKSPPMGPSPPDLAGIRFTTPTICDAIPVDSATPPAAGAYELHEDDWRDVELVAESQQTHVDANFADIRAVYEAEPAGVPGFARVHVRPEPVSPLGTMRMTLGDLVNAFPQGDQLAGVHLTGHPGGSAACYAISLPSGLVLYGGGAPEGLQHIAIDPWRLRGQVEADLAALTAFINGHSLSMVVWRQCRQMRTGDEIGRWLAGLVARIPARRRAVQADPR